MTTRTENPESFQLSIDIAEHYETAFVPAFFTQWAPLVCQRAGIDTDHRVLDVACGTGVVTRLAADLVGSSGSVVGLDLNDAMLAVAARVRPGLDWRQGDAQALPFGDEQFDAVTCQMALMFFPDPLQALQEMRRVVKVGGRVVIAVPSELEVQQAFRPFVDMVVGHAGPDAESLLSAYFRYGDADGLGLLVEGAGLTVVSAERCDGTYRAPTVEAFVAIEVESTPLIERLSPEVHHRITRDATTTLAPFTTGEGRVEAPFLTTIVTAVR